MVESHLPQGESDAGKGIDLSGNRTVQSLSISKACLGLMYLEYRTSPDNLSLHTSYIYIHSRFPPKSSVATYLGTSVLYLVCGDLDLALSFHRCVCGVTS